MREGYWIIQGYKVILTKSEKRLIKRHTTPRWELDLLAYKGSNNELLAIECKSYLDSKGVVFRNGEFDIPGRYKLFTESKLRRIVLTRLATDLHKIGACTTSPHVQLCLATGKIANITDISGLKSHFDSNGWKLFDDEWIREKLSGAAEASYENDVAHVVAKLLLRKQNRKSKLKIE